MLDVSKAPRRYSRVSLAWRAALRWCATRLFSGRALYTSLLARQVRVEHVELDAEAYAAPDTELRLVQLSDLHAGPFLDEATLQPVVELVTACDPHVLVFTGDFLTDELADLDLLGRFFARMPRRLGAYAVLGNHDSRGRREAQLARRLARQGVRVLHDEHVLLEHGGARLALVGLADIEEGRGADLDRACAGLPVDPPAVLLCHHPAVAERLPPGRFELVLCGHTHGGQLRAPWSGHLTREGVPAQGTHRLPGGGRLHVNRGLGALILPLRLGARPEITLIRWRGRR
ncbi:MAG: hypothetical protein DHS20C15_09680 [Planctomycetota bacterium]|nr:MAG: hypothetical protein DHS20C15_09680 [Planctomycetota bacterium]